jgi:putative acetyltransferase
VGTPSRPVGARDFVIRLERVDDRPAVDEVVRAAFVRHPDEVASFVGRIRASEHFVSELAVLAEDATGVIGHVMLSWVGLESTLRDRILNLTPMSVRPDRQRAGVGSALILDVLGRAERGRARGHGRGNTGVLPCFGFERASALGSSPLTPRSPMPPSWSSGCQGTTPPSAGRIVYPAAFGALGSSCDAGAPEDL